MTSERKTLWEAQPLILNRQLPKIPLCLAYLLIRFLMSCFLFFANLLIYFL